MEREYFLDVDIRRQSLISALIIIGLREIMNLFMIFEGGDVDVVSYVLVLIGTISVSYAAISAYTERIVVSSTGVTYKRIGLTFFVKWENVDRISLKRILRGSYQGIFAPKDKVEFTGFERFWVYGKEVSINLFRYSDNWRESELGQQIKQYAPHLLG